MAFSRYKNDPILPDKKGRSIATAHRVLRDAMRTGQIRPIRSITSTQADRLDTISGEVYGEGRYWWVLAAASDIGWGLQVPPGTIINILDLKDVERLVG